MDWTVFHDLNGSLRGHAATADAIEDFATNWAVPLFVLATLGLWLLDRPGRRYRWKIACLSALASAALGLLCAQVISHFWARERPFQAHPVQTLLLAPPSYDPSFPSDHAVAAFAVAFSVTLIGGWRMGSVFVAAAAIVGVTRVFVGLHYPGDVAGGSLLGLAAALAVFVASRNRWSPVVAALSRLTDPVARPGWEALDAARRRLRPGAGANG